MNEPNVDKPQLLLVDDDKSLLRLLTIRLEGEGFPSEGEPAGVALRPGEICHQGGYRGRARGSAGEDVHRL